MTNYKNLPKSTRTTFATYFPNSPKVTFPEVSDPTILDGKLPDAKKPKTLIPKRSK